MFRWLRNLFKRDRVPHVPYEVVINNTGIDDGIVAEVFPEHAEQLRRQRNLIEDNLQLQGLPQMIIGGTIGGMQAGQIINNDPFGDNDQAAGAWQGQAQLGQQQAANRQAWQYRGAFFDALHQQHPWGGQGGLFTETIDTLFLELKANGMPEPNLKDKDMLAVEFDKIKSMGMKLDDIYKKTKKKEYDSISDTIKHLRKNDVIFYRGKWGYDELIGDYLVSTSWSDMSIPLSILVKLPQTLEECIEVMEKGLWSSRKSPITKKDIA